MLVDVIQIILIFASLGTCALIVNRLVPLPFSLILVITGYIFSFFIVPLNIDTGIRAHNFQSLIMYGLLPILILESSLSLDLDKLKQFFPTVLTLATLGFMLATVITGAFLYFGINHAGFPLIAALLAGAVVSATDPVAVVAQLKSLGAPKSLEVVIEGESLFNDATAIVMFSVLLAIAQQLAEPDALTASGKFLVVLLGGATFGAFAGWVCAMISRVIILSAPHLALLMVLMAYGCVFVGEHLFHVSGIVAVLVGALVFKHFACTQYQVHEHALHHVIESLGFLANMFVFLLVGLVISIDMLTSMWIAILLAIAGITVARVISVYSSTALTRLLFAQQVDRRYPPVMIWGGLRGAVTIALVLSLPTSLPYWYTIQSIGFGVVLFTLVVQATTTGLLVRKLNI